MIDFSLFVFLFVVMVAFGYMAGNARSFNVWKLALLGFVLVPFFIEFNLGRQHIITMLVGFGIGFFLPYVSLLEGFRDSVSNAINLFRYRGAYEDIKRREAEVEELRRQYERERDELFRKQSEWERKRRQDEAQGFRAKGQDSNEQDSGGGEGFNHKGENGEKGASSYSAKEQKRRDCLQVLGLVPDGVYDFNDIKKAYRKMALKVHPDMHQNVSEGVRKEMEERFKRVNEANAWLAGNWGWVISWIYLKVIMLGVIYDTLYE